jgi:hypothetical protein
MHPRIEGDALMLDLLDGVPAPHRRRLRIGAVKMARIRQQGMGKDRGEMLQRHRHREADDGRLVAKQRQPRVDIRLQRRDVVARIPHPPVEGEMFAGVRHLLLGEGRDLRREPRLRAVAKAAHAVHEQPLALRERHRQGIVESGGDGIAAQPPACKSVAPAEAFVARLYAKIRRGGDHGSQSLVYFLLI